MSQREQRIRTPNKRYKEEADADPNLEPDEDVEVDDNDVYKQANETIDSTILRNENMDNDAELHDTDDPNVFHCTEEKSTAFYLDLLDKAERENLGVSDNVVLPPAGTLIIFNIGRYTNNHRQGLEYEKIRRSMRVDGYRLVNAGTHKVAKSVMAARAMDRVAYRSYNTLYNSRDPRKIDSRFKRKEYWYSDGRCVLFHYIGDDDLAKRITATPHGNARKNFVPYQRTDPLLLQEARERIMAGAKPEDVFASMKDRTDPSRTIKNVKQLRNVKERIDQERKRKASVFFNIHTLHDMLRFEGTRQPFIYNISAIRIVATLICEPLIEEFINTANLNSNETYTQVLFYDTSLTTCGYQVALLSFRHDIFDDDPPVPLAFVVGDNLTVRDHVSLFETILECFPRLGTIPLALASTIPLNLEHFWPEMQEVRAWNDIKSQLKRDLVSTLSLAPGDWRNVMRVFEEMTAMEDETSFDKKWETLRGRQTAEVAEWMEKSAIPDWKSLCAPWTLEEKKIKYRDTRGIMRIPIGSFDYLLSTMGESKMSIDGIIASLFYLCQFTINEMERGYYQLGSFTIKEQWFSLTDDPANIPRQPFAPYPDEIINFVNEVALNTTFSLNKRKRLSMGIHNEMAMIPARRPMEWNDSA